MGYYGKSGVYMIICIPNKKVYIGSSKNLGKRLNGHKSNLKANQHVCKDLQDDYNKYGSETYFSFYNILEFTEDKKEREAYWIRYYNSVDKDFGYNIMYANKESNILNNGNKRINKGSGIISINVITKEVTEYETIHICCIKNNIKSSDYIRRVALYWKFPYGVEAKSKNLKKTYKGYIYIFKEDYNTEFDYVNFKKEPLKLEPKVKIIKLVKPMEERNLGRVEIKITNIETNEVNIFQSIKECYINMGFIKSKVIACLSGERKSHHGYRFEYTGNRGIPPGLR